MKTALEDLSNRNIGTVFEEYGGDRAEEVAWERMPEDRRRLEQLVLGEALGLNADEQITFVKALVDLTRYRIQRKESVKDGFESKRADLREFAGGIAEEVSVE